MLTDFPELPEFSIKLLWHCVFSKFLPKFKISSIFQEVLIFPRFSKTLEERYAFILPPHSWPLHSPCLALTLYQVREGSGLPPMARHTNFTRVPARRRCPSGEPSIHSFWAGSVEKARKRGFTLWAGAQGWGLYGMSHPWGKGRSSHFTFRVSDFLKVSLVKASLKASQVRVRPLSSRRTRNVRLDTEMWPP